MDPVSYLFSAYLNLVQQQVSDIYGTELKSLVVEYEGEQIPFAFQFWQLQPKSVCRSYEQDAWRFSQLPPHDRRHSREQTGCGPAG